jgi:hypothetical protein
MDDAFEAKDYSNWSIKKMLRPTGLWRDRPEIKELIKIHPYARLIITSSMREWLDSRNVRYVYGYDYIVFERNEDTTAFALKYGSKIKLLHTTN